LMLTYGILGGVGLGFIYLPSIISVTCYFHKKRALVTCMAVCGAGVGTFVFAPLGEYLLDTYSLRGALLIQSGIIMNGAVFGAMLRPLTATKKKRSKKEDETTKTEEAVKLLNNGDTKQPAQNGGNKPIVKYNNVDVDKSKPQSNAAEIKIVVTSEDDDVKHDIKADLLSNDASRLSAVKSHLRDSNRMAISVGDVRVLAKNASKKTDEASKEADDRPHRSRTNSTSSERKLTRPLYRKDIFLSGSLLHVAEFRSYPDVRSYMKEVTIVPSDGVDGEGKSTGCMKAASDALKMMLNCGLFADPIFVLACLINVLAMFALFLPFIFIVKLAESKGVPLAEGTNLLSVIGITNTVGRLAIGGASVIPWVNTIIVHNMSLVLMGVALILNQFCLNFISMSITAGAFGLGLAGFISLTSVILSEMIGLQKLTNAFGLLTMFRGAAVIAGPPVAGLLYEQMNDYDVVFNIAGVAMIAAGVIFCAVHLPCITPYRVDLQQKKAESIKEPIEDDIA